MSWIFLLGASFFEIFFSTFLKFSDGFSKFLPSFLATLCAVGGIISLSKALTTIPVGVAYSIWVGIGIIGSNIMGAIFFGESLDPKKVFFVTLILTGIIGLYRLAEA